MSVEACGATSGPYVCDKPRGHGDDHRAYDSEHDAVMFWPVESREPLRLWAQRILQRAGTHTLTLSRQDLNELREAARL